MALEALEQLKEEGEAAENVLAPIRAEALMCRAYAHFMLVNLFAEHYDPATAGQALGIPILDKAERKAGITYTRNTVKEVYDFIEHDIEAAFPDISNSNYERVRWHFNREAAATFASRFYLYRGLDDDWKKAVQYANQAVETNPSALLRDWGALQAIADYEQRMIDYSKAEYPCNFMIISTVSYSYVYMIGKYATDDPLLKSILYYIIPTEKDVPSTRYAPGPILSWGVSYPNRFLPKYNQYFRLSDINSSEGWPYIMFVAFAAEEALLNKAEACVMLNDTTGAVNALNSYYSMRIKNYDSKTDTLTVASVVRRYGSNTMEPAPHYYLQETQNAFIKCILTIRRAEFIYEGLRWFDIKRMHIQIEHKVYGDETMVLAPDDPRRVLELPDAALADGIPGNFDPESPNSSSITVSPFSYGDYLKFNENITK
jgi:hypothetical protein